MLKTFQKRDVLVRIFLGFVVGIIGLMMVVTLVPGPVGSLSDNPNAIADVGGQQISVDDVQRRLSRLERMGQIQGPLRALYARQIVDQLVFSHLLEIEARRLGVRVTDEERAERIRLYLPTAFEGDRFVGMERYSSEVELPLGMSVSEFEEAVSQSLLEEKFRRLVTDGVTVTPKEIEEEFIRQNEKVKIDYVVVKPEELQAQVSVPEAELASYFEKNKSRYTVPERRSARYVLLDMGDLRQGVQGRNVKEDGRIVQSVHFDPRTGETTREETHQGSGTQGCWTRGQAWGVYGFAAAYRATGEERFIEVADRAATYYVRRAGADLVPFY